MDYKKVVPMVCDILEECNGGENPRVCDKCIFCDICMGLFTGDFGRLAPTTEEERK